MSLTGIQVDTEFVFIIHDVIIILYLTLTSQRVWHMLARECLLFSGTPDSTVFSVILLQGGWSEMSIYLPLYMPDYQKLYWANGLNCCLHILFIRNTFHS